MELWVLNTELQAIHLIDTFESLIWTERYYEYGDFEIHSSVTDTLRQILVTDNYLWSKDSECVMIIEDIQIESDSEDGGVLTVTGRSLEAILERRIVYNKTVLTGSLQDGVKKLLDENIISPTDDSRKIENFVFEESNDMQITPLTVDLTLYGETLYEVIQSLCETNKIGFKIRLNNENQFVFSLYAGTDRSYDQLNTPYVIFSPQFDNLINSNYLESKKALKTIALVASSENDDGSRTTITVERGSGAGTGLNRRELFVDGGSVSDTDENGKNLSDTAYKAKLKQKGKEELTANKLTQTFEGEVETSRMFRYGSDFFKGDIVQVTNEYGIEAKTRIVEFVISQDVNGIDTYPTFETVDDITYTELLYIESTGTQWIDTGYLPNQNTRIVMDVVHTGDLSGNIALFGARDALNGISFTLWWYDSKNTSSRFDYIGDISNKITTGYTPDNDVQVTVDANKNEWSFGEYSTSMTYTEFRISHSLTLLGVNTAGTIGNKFTGRIYSCKIYDNDILVRDFIPVLDDNNEACLYDKATKTFFYNVGTEDFIAGTS